MELATIPVNSLKVVGRQLMGWKVQPSITLFFVVTTIIINIIKKQKANILIVFPMKILILFR